MLEQGDKVVGAFLSALIWMGLWALAVGVWRWWIDRND